MSRKGSCLCGALRYEVEGDFDGVWMCHCSNCRKVSGATGNTIIIVPRDRFRWLAGEDHRVTYAVRPTYSITRCKTCGTPLPAEEDETNVYLTAGTLDEPLGTAIANHIFYDSRADWDRDTHDVRYFVERSTGPECDVPIRVDFRDPATARRWVEETRVRKPFRPRFFAAFCAALAGRPRQRILELGSGPGQLAREIVQHCDVASYVALDWSAAMHEIAAEHLGDVASRVTPLIRDFRDPTWTTGLGPFDAVVTLQAAHETRHKQHVVPLLERARALLVPGGLLLYCDGYLHPSTTLPALSFERSEQPRALERAGYADVRLLHDEGNQALYSAVNPVGRLATALRTAS